MPLPDSNQIWPPAEWAPILNDIKISSVWYEGDEDKLADYYAGLLTTSGRSRSLFARVKFWGKLIDQPTKARERLHIPAAADIAAVSADHLFGDTPTLMIPEAHSNDTNTGTVSETEAQNTEDRLQELMQLDGTASTLLEGAEVCSGLGDVYLRPVWAPKVADRPILSIVHGDHAIPEFAYKQLVAVTLWSDVAREGGKVWRHLERYERGVILHGLYLGTESHLGTRVGFDTIDATWALGLPPDGVVRLPDALKDEMVVRHVPNVRPNRKHRGMPIGRADTAGNEPLMDSLDEIWSSLVREIRLGKSRVITSSEFLTHRGRGMGATFDTDQDIFSPLNLGPAALEGDASKMIVPVNWALRIDDHIKAAYGIFDQLTQTSGYSAQSFGNHGDGGTMKTATEVAAKNDQSVRTTNRKRAYWQRAVEDVMEFMLVIDRDIFQSGVEPLRPRLDWADQDEDLTKLSGVLNQLELAKAVSTETKVKMLHPKWDDAEVQEEVDRILQESGSLADPTGSGAPNFGAPVPVAPPVPEPPAPVPVGGA